MASGPITSYETDGETVSDFIFWGSKITADGDFSHEIKRRLLLGRKVKAPQAHSLDDPLSNSKKYTFPIGSSLLTFQDLALKLGLPQLLQELPRWLTGKESACSARDLSLIPGSGRSPGEGNGNPLQYSCLENPIDRGAWWCTVHGVAKSRT